MLSLSPHRGGKKKNGGKNLLQRGTNTPPPRFAFILSAATQTAEPRFFFASTMRVGQAKPNRPMLMRMRPSFSKTLLFVMATHIQKKKKKKHSSPVCEPCRSGCSLKLEVKFCFIQTGPTDYVAERGSRAD